LPIYILNITSFVFKRELLDVLLLKTLQRSTAHGENFMMFRPT